MKIKILAIGDVVGKPGRKAIAKLVPRLVEREKIEFVVANGENSAGSGTGLGVQEAQQILEAGVDCITLGDHVWRQPDVVQVLQRGDRVMRPANMPKVAAGRGWLEFDLPSGGRILVVNLIGRVFMDPPYNAPFEAIDSILERPVQGPRLVLVDFHAEATSEKAAMARYLDGRITALVGTHTHVQTSDNRIFPGGTAFISDLGMTGPHESILGRKIEPVVYRMRTTMHARFDVATEDLRLQGVLITADTATGKAVAIERVDEPLTE